MAFTRPQRKGKHLLILSCVTPGMSQVRALGTRSKARAVSWKPDMQDRFDQTWIFLSQDDSFPCEAVTLMKL